MPTKPSQLCDRRQFLGASAALLELTVGACQTQPDRSPPAAQLARETRAAVAHSPPESGRAPAPSSSGSILPVGTRVGFDSAHPAFGEDPALFEAKRPPGPDDWLSRFPHTEVGFDEYVALRPTGQRGARNTLVLMPMGRLPQRAAALFEVLRRFTELYFDTSTRIAPAVPLPVKGRRLRSYPSGRRYQYRTRTILDRSLAVRLPKDAICLLGVTFEDLYPEKSWNFVFGEASLDERVGVYSLARFFSEFGQPPASPNHDPRGLERSFKILAHETGHMFSLHHCRSLECLMNGSNSLDETDRAPLHVGPRCLRKLQYNIRFDITSRYRRLLALYQSYGLTQEAAWTRLRLQRLTQQSVTSEAAWTRLRLQRLTQQSVTSGRGRSRAG